MPNETLQKPMIMPTRPYPECLLAVHGMIANMRDEMREGFAKVNISLLMLTSKVDGNSRSIDKLANAIDPVINGNGVPSHRELSHEVDKHILQHSTHEARQWTILSAICVGIVLGLFNLFLMTKIVRNNPNGQVQQIEKNDSDYGESYANTLSKN